MNKSQIFLFNVFYQTSQSHLEIRSSNYSQRCMSKTNNYTFPMISTNAEHLDKEFGNRFVKNTGSRAFKFETKPHHLMYSSLNNAKLNSPYLILKRGPSAVYRIMFLIYTNKQKCLSLHETDCRSKRTPVFNSPAFSSVCLSSTLNEWQML